MTFALLLLLVGSGSAASPNLQRKAFISVKARTRDANTRQTDKTYHSASNRTTSAQSAGRARVGVRPGSSRLPAKLGIAARMDAPCVLPGAWYYCSREMRLRAGRVSLHHWATLA
jgi:hypothetical protein